MTFRLLQWQMEELANQTKADFLRRMDRFLREHQPGWIVGLGAADGALEVWLARALALAHDHAVRNEPEVAQLILLLTRLGLDDRPAFVDEVLARPHLVGKGRVRALVEAARQAGYELDDVIVYDWVEG